MDQCHSCFLRPEPLDPTRAPVPDLHGFQGHPGAPSRNTSTSLSAVQPARARVAWTARRALAWQGGSPPAAVFPPARRTSHWDYGLRVQGHWLLAAAGPSGQLPEKNQARPSAPLLRPDLLTSLCFPPAAFCRQSLQLTRAVLNRSPWGSLSSCWGAAEGSTSVIIRRSGPQGWG